jgi:hypothetical protein
MEFGNFVFIVIIITFIVLILRTDSLDHLQIEQLEEEEQESEDLEINLENIADDNQSFNSMFFQSITNDFPQPMQEKAYHMFDIIVRLRWIENLPESTFVKIMTDAISPSLNLHSEVLSATHRALNDKISKFASSRYLQKIYLTSLGGYVKPTEIPIEIANEQEKFTYQYVPIKDVISLALKNPALLREIVREKSQHFAFDNCIFSSELTCDQKRWERIKGKLRIQLYSDEFTISNPLGPSRHNQKYMVVYCSFTNLPLKDRLKRKDLFLLIIANHKHIDDQTLSAILDPLNYDLEDLFNNGVDIKLGDGNMLNIECTLSTFIADNLAQYVFLGYSSNFYLGFRCRLCGGNYEEIQRGCLSMPLFGDNNDIKIYWEYVRQADGLNLPIEARRVFGLMRKFKFASQTRSIDPWNITPVDVMHDILEGIIPKLTSVILQHLKEMFLKNREQMIAIISKRQFYDALFSVKSVTGGFIIDGDAIQVSLYCSHLLINLINIRKLFREQKYSLG